MKHYCRFLLLGVLCLLGGLRAQAQAPAWQSALAFDQTGGDVYSSQVVANAAGDLIIAGYFTATVRFGATSLTSSGSNDIFVAKWNPVSKQFLWALRAGGTSDDYGFALAVNGANVYIGGTFSGVNATFGAITLTNTSSNLANLYVAKLTDQGSSASFTWALRGGGNGVPAVRALAVSGNAVYLTGQFNGPTADFGATILTKAGGEEAFVAKVTDQGSSASFTWAQRLGGQADDYAYGLALSGSSLYLTGYMGSNNAATVGNVALSSSVNGSGKLFVSKFTDVGTTLTYNWTRLGGASTSDVIGQVIAVSGANLYVAGYFMSTATLGTTTLSAQGNADIFLTKLTDNGGSGTFGWALGGGGITGYDVVHGLLVKGTSIYLNGEFFGITSAYGPFTLTNDSNNGSTRDIFVVRVTDAGASGSYVWALQAGGGDNDYSSTLTAIGSQLYLTGYARSSATTFGSQTIINPVGGGHHVGFIASLTDAVGLATVAPAALAGVALYPNPARSTASVRVPPVAGAAEVTITLRDLLGRAVRTHQLALPATGLTQELNLASLTAGVYTVHIHAGAATVVRQLSIE